jgi:hypothetical protein
VKWQLANQESERKRAYKFGLDSFIYGIITSRPTPIVPLHSPTTLFSLTLMRLDDEKVSLPVKNNILSTDHGFGLLVRILAQLGWEEIKEKYKYKNYILWRMLTTCTLIFFLF